MDGEDSEELIQLRPVGVYLRCGRFSCMGLVFWGFLFRGERREAMGGGDPIASIGSHRIWTSPHVPRMGDHLEMTSAPRSVIIFWLPVFE
jgi:hypothetical protein